MLFLGLLSFTLGVPGITLVPWVTGINLAWGYFLVTGGTWGDSHVPTVPGVTFLYLGVPRGYGGVIILYLGVHRSILLYLRYMWVRVECGNFF